MRIRDCVWIWGHPPGKLNEPCNLDSQMTPMESALYLGARNVFYIPMGKKMNMTQPLVWDFIFDGQNYKS